MWFLFFVFLIFFKCWGRKIKASYFMTHVKYMKFKSVSIDSFIGIQPHSFMYVSSMTVPGLQRQIAAETT